MMQTPNKYRAGFTLVEIMIVMAILGIILAIAMPAFIRAREISRAKACQATLTKIDAAIKMYAADAKLEREDAVSFDDLVLPGATGYLRGHPRCPAGGTYTITVVGETATCSIGENEGAPYAPHVIDTPIPADTNDD